MGRLVTSPGILKNVQGQIDHVTDMYDDIKDNNLKPLTITLTSVANANGAISVVTNDDRITEDMKAIDIEVGTPESFKAPVTITTGAGTVTLTCTNASGNSTVKATFIKTSPVEGGEDYPPAVTSTEFDILADRIGSLATLETTDKSDLVSAVNEVVGDVDTLSNKLTWKLLAEKSDTSGIVYPSEWNELWVIATTDATYGWSTVSILIPKSLSNGDYVTAVGNNNIVLTVYKGPNSISIEPSASSNVARWKAYYR